LRRKHSLAGCGTKIRGRPIQKIQTSPADWGTLGSPEQTKTVVIEAIPRAVVGGVQHLGVVIDVEPTTAPQTAMRSTEFVVLSIEWFFLIFEIFV
jgi:hypothetical protein